MKNTYIWLLVSTLSLNAAAPLPPLQHNFFTVNPAPVVEVVAGSNATVQASLVGPQTRRFTVNAVVTGGTDQTNWPITQVTNANIMFSDDGLTNQAGISANGTNYGLGVGYYALGYSNGAAVGTGAIGYNYGAAFGYNAEGWDAGAAFGYNAAGWDAGAAFGGISIGYNYGAAFGMFSHGYDYGSAFGYNAEGYNYGAAFGNGSEGNNYGAAFGIFSHGYNYGAAFGYNAEGYNYGVAAGTGANGIGLGNVAIGGNDGSGVNASVPAGWTDTVELGRGLATLQGGLNFRGFPIVNSSGLLVADMAAPYSNTNMALLNGTNRFSGTNVFTSQIVQTNTAQANTFLEFDGNRTTAGNVIEYKTNNSSVFSVSTAGWVTTPFVTVGSSYLGSSLKTANLGWVYNDTRSGFSSPTIGTMQLFGNGLNGNGSLTNMQFGTGSTNPSIRFSSTNTTPAITLVSATGANEDFNVSGSTTSTNGIYYIPQDEAGVATNVWQPVHAWGSIMSWGTNVINGGANTYAKITNQIAVTTSRTNQFGANIAGGVLTNLIAGYYRVGIHLSGVSVDNAAQVEGDLLLNAVERDEVSFITTYDTPSRMKDMSASGILYIPSNTSISFQVKSSGAGGITVYRAQMVIGSP